MERGISDKVVVVTGRRPRHGAIDRHGIRSRYHNLRDGCTV